MGNDFFEKENLDRFLQEEKFEDAFEYLSQFGSNADALYYLGWLFEYHKHDADKALECYVKSSALGNSLGMYSAGFVLLNQGNKERAVEFLEQGAALNNPKCLLLLASLFFEERKDPDKVISYCTRSAELNDMNAQVLLASIYMDGEIVEQSQEKAVVWFSKAAESGSSEAQFQLSHILTLPDAEIWLEKAAGQGHPIALYELAMKRLHEQNNLNEAVRLLTYSGEEGNPMAMFELFKIFSEGKLIEKNDEIAYKWCISAAMSHHEEAIFELGKRLLDKGNESAAIEWLKKGCDLNNVSCMELLATIYCKNPNTLSIGNEMKEKAYKLKKIDSN